MVGGLLGLAGPPRPEDVAMSDLVSSYWVNFAKNGDPNGPGLPAWPAFAAPTQSAMHFDGQVERSTGAEHGADQGARQLLRMAARRGESETDELTRAARLLQGTVVGFHRSPIDSRPPETWRRFVERNAAVRLRGRTPTGRDGERRGLGRLPHARLSRR